MMAPTLEQAITEVFGGVQPEQVAATVTSPVESDVLSRARNDFDKAQEAIRQGRWEAFGKAMDELNVTLKPENLKPEKQE